MQTYPAQTQPQVIFLASTPTVFQSQPFYQNQQVFPNQTVFYTQPNSVQPMTQQIQGLIPCEGPMQIQYMTSLYAPYSNNNIFSNVYPVVISGAPTNGEATPKSEMHRN